MTLWLVTLGNSDVQVRDADVWPDWHRQIKRSIYNIERKRFDPSRTDDDDGVPYRIASRVLGLAYQELEEEVKPQLEFPLLKEFCEKLPTESINQIIVLTSDQSNIFEEESRESYRCPYWQDTCLLYPIVSQYLQSLLPAAKISQLVLTPDSLDEGLDDWDAVLKVVRREIRVLKFEMEPQKVFVSHQAGTPAISSAVQFCSLAQFSDRVQFLVSNEYNQDLTKILPGSNYLIALKQQQALKLLDRHDYTGLKEIFYKYLNPKDQIFLDAAIQWNFAEFDKFKDKLKEHIQFTTLIENRVKAENWWWIAYEAAYLGVVRLKQENTVEAFFHSFRAFEGIFAAWGRSQLRNQLGEYFEIQDGISYLNLSILDVTEKEYFSGKKPKELKKELEKRREKLKNDSKEEKLMFDMAMLCKFFKAYRYQDYRDNCEELKIFWDSNKDNNVSEKRNFIVHQIQGMSETDLMKFWGVSLSKEWESRLLKFLNFIVKDDFPKGFESLESASLMSQVHQALKSAIANL